MRKTDTTAGIILLATTIITFLEIRKLPIGNLTSPQAGFFPFLLGVILAILSLILLGQAIRRREMERGKGKRTSGAVSLSSAKRISLTMGALFILGVFFEWMGYLLSAFLLIAFLLVFVGRQKWWVAITAGFLSAFFCYLVFGLLLKGSLPTGILV
jgi:hypothetical protein